MKPHPLLLLVLGLGAALAALGANYITPLTDTNGVIRTPTNFFSANIQPLTNALNAAGWSAAGGGGGGSLWINDGASLYPTGATGSDTVWTNDGAAIYPN